MGFLCASLRFGLLCLASLILGLPEGRAQDNVSCTPEDGCAVLVPDYWTVVGNLNFNFTGLEDQGPLGDVLWGLGSAPGLLNVIPYQSLAGSTLQFSLVQVKTLFEQELQIGNLTFSNQTLIVLNYSLSGQALLNGNTYYVSVSVSSSDPVLNATSLGVKVATSTPQLNRGYIYNTQDCSVADDQRDPTVLWACWDEFTDPVTPITGYSVTAFALTDKAGAVSATVDVGLDRKAVLTGLNLKVGEKYYVEVEATNEAGLTGYANGPPVQILGDADGLSTVGITFVTAAGIIVAALGIFLIGYLFFRRRYRLKMAERQQEREKTKVLKSLMYGLVTAPGDGLAPAEQLRNARSLAFVITDLQSSTAQAATSPHAFLKVQEIHDTVIREGIAKHNGYEINTEGDAFHIAFATVAQAVLFSMETQYRLLDTAWPREVLKLPACEEVHDKDGTILMKGPRVRMGVHYAAEGTVARRLHLLTKHRVFSGPGFQVACEIGDAACGGQVLLTHDAWLKLEASMAAAGFPTVKQIGLYKLKSWPSPIWIYEVSQLLGRQLQRLHPEPRKIKMLETGWGLNIVPPPEPKDGKLLTFVSMRLAPPASSQKAELRREEGTSIRSTITSVLAAATAPGPELSPALARQLFECLATSAMQFRGYIHLIRETQGVFGAVFRETLDAVRFAHASQTRLLYTTWPNAGKDPHCGKVEFTPDGRLLFFGPRVAMAVHEASDFEAEKVALPSQGQRESDVHYFGSGVELAQSLGRAAHGGQVVLSESAWASIQDQLPGSSQVVSLGTHVVDHSVAGPMLLMEVMPAIMGRRSFPAPATEEMIEPGFRDSPNPKRNMALVFTRVARPQEVIAAEQSRGRLSDEEIVRIMTAFNTAVGKVSRLVRRLLPEYDGYECKEPEPGKFTLAFHDLEAAVRWACILQKELMEVAWPETILSWADCEEVSVRRADGQELLLWKGLRVRVGMACGKPQYRKPLNTGRADYYGSLPNLAARVAALAHPGQILVEGSSGFAEEVKWYPEDNIAVLSLPTFSNASIKEDIELQLLGFYLIKDLDDAKPILQANPASLTGREYEPLAAAMRVSVPPAKRHRSGSSFLSIVSTDSQPSGTGRNPLTTLARTGSRLFNGVMAELPPLPGLGAKGKSLPASTQNRRSLEEVWLHARRPAPGKRSPWGSFADTLAKRVRAVGEVARLPLSSSSQQDGAVSHPSRPSASMELEEESGISTNEIQMTHPGRSFSTTTASSAAGAIDTAAQVSEGSRSASATYPRQEAVGSIAQLRSSSLPGEEWLRPERQSSPPAPLALPPTRPATSPFADSPDTEGFPPVKGPVPKSYAEEVARTFAFSGFEVPESSSPRSSEKRGLRRADTPKEPLSDTLLLWSDGASLQEHSGLGLDASASDADPVLEDAFDTGSTPREIAPRTALQMGRTNSVSDELRRSADQDEERFSLSGRGNVAFSFPRRQTSPAAMAQRGEEGVERIQRSSRSEICLQPVADVTLISRSSSATLGAQRMSRFSARRNAVLDVTHRRQVAQEGLSESGFVGTPTERTWSFATEGAHSEFEPVPEEVSETDEVELASLSRRPPSAARASK